MEFLGLVGLTLTYEFYSVTKIVHLGYAAILLVAIPVITLVIRHGLAKKDLLIKFEPIN